MLRGMYLQVSLHSCMGIVTEVHFVVTCSEHAPFVTSSFLPHQMIGSFKKMLNSSLLLVPAIGAELYGSIARWGHSTTFHKQSPFSPFGAIFSPYSLRFALATENVGAAA